MEGKWIFLIIIILLLPSVLSECNSSQININTASKSELGEIYQIGESRAKEIINLRKNKSFESVDGLTRVDGIGDSYLEEIKQEDLACIETSPEKEENYEENNTKEIENKSEDNDYETIKITNNEDSDSKNSDRSDNKKNNDKPEVIKLSHANSKNEEENKKSRDPKVIKKPDSFNFQENKSKYANYGLVAVALIVICSMLIKYRKNKYKNEFRE